MQLRQPLARRVLGLAGLMCGVVAPGCGDAEPKATMIEMRDGVELAATVAVPEGDGPFPTVMVRTPYGRELEEYLIHRYVPRGVAVVIQDTRGRFESGGADQAFATDGDGPLQDGHDTCKWIVAQPWSDGTIVSTGGSALGITQYMAAAAECPGLVAISAESATPNVYSDALFQNGVRRYALSHNWLEMQDNLAYEAMFEAHPFEDEAWDPIQTEDRFPSVNVAGLHIGGWYDIFQRGTIDAYVGYQHHGGDGARGRQFLIMGPWAHTEPVPAEDGGVDFPASADQPPMGDPGEVSGALLGHYLGRPEGELPLEAIPTVQYWVMGDVDDPEAPGNEWRTADDWPIPAAKARWYLGEGGVLQESCPAAGASSTSYLFDPADPTPTLCGNNMTIEAGPCDHRPVESRPDNMLFESPVLDAPLEITGRMWAHLQVELDQPDTDLMVRLTDVYPDGRSILISDGALRLASRGSTTQLDLLQPGEIVEAVVDLWNTSIVIAPGHHLRVAVTSSNWPRFAVNHNNGAPYPESVEGPAHPVTVRLHHDAEHPSWIELPDPTRAGELIPECP